MSTAPYIEVDNEELGTYMVHAGHGSDSKQIYYTTELIELRKAIDKILEGKGLMINCHSWNGMILHDSSEVQGLYGCSADCLISVAENQYKSGKFKTVSVWECIRTFGIEDEVKTEEDAEEPEEEPEDEKPTEHKNCSLDNFMGRVKQ